MTKSQNPSVGGRSKLAPYKTTHVRIPEALKPTVELLVHSYKELVSGYDDALHPELIASAKNAIAPVKSQFLDDESKQLLNRILRQSFKLKANSDELTKQKIRDILALIRD